MATKEGPWLLQPVPGNLSDGSLALRHTFQLIDLNCSETQKLQLVKVFSQISIDQILCWAKMYSPRSSTTSSLNRSSQYSKYSVASDSSQSSSLSIPSQLQGITSGGRLAGIKQERSNRHYSQASSVYQPTKTGNQDSLFPAAKTKEICIACNVSFANQSACARHQREHCEQVKEWQCRNCSPMKTFRRQENFISHYNKDHGLACADNCEETQKGLCEEHLNYASVDLPEKKAWGCPCCDSCFDSFEAWKIHSTDHQVENEKVVGWSLSTMVQSLLFKQPYLAVAVNSSCLQWHDWNTVDWTKISDSKLQELREALERHKLPGDVQAHWEYRSLQPPDALVKYAFCLGTSGQAYQHGLPIISNNASTVEETAEQTQVGMQSQTSNGQTPVGMQSQHFKPPLGSFNPADPLAYDLGGSLTTESAHVDPYLDRDSLRHRSTAAVETHAPAVIHHVSHQERFMQDHDQNLHASFPTLSPEEAQSLAVVSSCGSIPQDAGHDGGRRYRAVRKKSVKNIFKDLSATKSNILHMGLSIPTSAPPVSRILGSNWTAAIPGHNRYFTGYESTETHQSSQQQAVASNQMSDLPDAWEHASGEQYYQ